MKRKFLPAFLSLVALFFGSIGSGFSTWLVSQKITVETAVESRPPVCYIVGTSNYYVTIEKGLNAAISGQTLMVIPGTNPTITTSCAIKSGVTLRLPYDTSASDSMTATLSGTTYGVEISSTGTGLALTVTVASGVTLTNNGTLQISGMLSGGNGGAASSGHTASKWANLCLDSNAQYMQTAGSTFTYCYGFITEKTPNNGSQCIFNGGTIYSPFILRDFRGGSVYSGIYSSKSKKCFVFNDYEMKNIEPLAKYYYPSTLYGMANLYASSQQNASQMKIIGTDTSSFTQMSATGAYVEIKYTKATGISTLDFYGGMTTNSMSLSAAGVTVNSSEFYFPLGYRQVLSFNKLPAQSSCTYTIGQDYEFLPGSSLAVGEGATVNATDHSIVFYAVFNDVKVGGGPYPSGKAAAYLRNNGSFTAGSLAGLVKSQRSGASLVIQTSASVTTYQVNGSSGSSFLTTCTFQEIANSLTFDKYDGTTSLFVSGSYVQNVPAGTYTSITDANAMSGFMYYVAGPITYVLTISLNNASVSITIGSGSPESYSSSTTINVAENSSVTYSVSYSESKSQSTTVTKPDGSSLNTQTGSFQMSGNATISATSTAGSCLTGDSLITLVDGSQKMAKDIVAGDSLLVFNHETGTLESSKVVFNDIEPRGEFTLINCEFSNGETIQLSSEHGFFSLDENRYVYITEVNYLTYLGKKFVTFDAKGQKQIVTLSNVYLSKEVCVVCSPVTERTLDYFVNGMLSMPGGISGLFNIFDYDPDTLQFDQAKKQADIEQYGLLSLDDFGDAISEYMFDVFNGQYLGVAIGKGLLTWDDIAYLANRYGPLC